jgi:hypothetical protein
MAQAETIKVACEGTESDKPYKLNFVHERGDPTTLKVSGSYGDMEMGGGSSVNDGDDGQGNKISVTNIWGSGDLNLIMPDQAAIEACVKQKLKPEQMTDKDIVFITIPDCANSVPPSKEPVPVKVSVQLSILDPASVLAIIKRTYVKPTDLPEGTITLSPMMPPECKTE